MGKREYDILVALGFSTTLLGAIHMLTFVWLTAFVYKGNIRGYVPAGLTGLLIMAIASLIILIYLSLVGRRDRKSASYLFGGIVGIPAAFILSSTCSSALITLFGYTVTTDILINLIGAILLIVIAVKLHLSFREN